MLLMRTLFCDKCKMELTEKENNHLEFRVKDEVVMYDTCGNCYKDVLDHLKKFLS